MKLIFFLGCLLFIQIVSANIHLPPPSGQQINSAKGDPGLLTCPVDIGSSSGCSIDIGIASNGESDTVNIGGKGGDLDFTVGNAGTLTHGTARIFADLGISSSAEIEIGTSGDVTITMGSPNGATTLYGYNFLIDGTNLEIDFSDVTITTTDDLALYAQDDFSITAGTNLDILAQDVLFLTGDFSVTATGDFLITTSADVQFISTNFDISASGYTYIHSNLYLTLDSDTTMTIHADSDISASGNALYIQAADLISITSSNDFIVDSSARVYFSSADDFIVESTLNIDLSSDQSFLVDSLNVSITATEDFFLSASSINATSTSSDVSITAAQDFLLSASSDILISAEQDFFLVASSITANSTSSDILISASDTIVFDGHLSTYNPDLPTLDFSTECNTPDSSSSTGTDTAGSIVLITGVVGAGPAGCVITLTFDTAYNNVPIVLVTPSNQDTATVGMYVSAATTTTFSITLSTSAAETTYSFNYFVIDQGTILGA